MRLLPARSFHFRRHLFASLFIFLILLQVLFLVPSVFATPTPVPPTPSPTTPAAAPTPTPAGSGITIGIGNPSLNWLFDAEVTEVGKNAERARQFLWWTLSHPGIHTAPVLAQIWGFSRNIVYVFVILVIVVIGFSFILLRRRANMVNIPPLLVKIGAVLLYATFSYLLILALIQTSDILMKFFIEHVGGQNLFNVIFSGAGNMDENYTSFLGYRDKALESQEMINTSLFLIRMTSLSYFVMALLLILRTIILWFLLVVSPFLAILMPFVFVRNIGWIWIGVFFQWLFYGPLMALFLGAITNFWASGIPFPFDFSRVNKPEGQVYRTSINILYGGPAQTVGPGNSANYIDTYAEYVISLVMLWAAILLPWLLLRIFRDYCCEVIAASHATLTGIFDRLRQYPLPPSSQPVVPTTTASMARELPFRQRVEERIKEVQKTRIENIKEISKVNTSEIVKAMDLSVSTLSDVSRMELDQQKLGKVKQNLDRLVAPEKITSPHEREQFANLKRELQTRAYVGDRMAQTLLAASDNNPAVLASYASTIAGRHVSTVTPVQRRGVFAPQMTVGTSFQPKMSVSTLTVNTLNIANQVNVSDKKVREVLEIIPAAGNLTTQVVSQVAAKTGLSETKVQEIVAASQTTTIPVSPSVSVEDYEEVKKMWLNHYRSAPIPTSATIKDRESWLVEEEKKLANISNLISSPNPQLKKEGLEKVAEILPFMLLGNFSEPEIVTYIKAKLEADRQVRSEVELEKKAKEEVQKEMVEEEETLLEVPAVQKEEAKQKTAAQEQKMEIPKRGEQD